MEVERAFLLTVDVEDWFQVENFKSAIPFSSWNQMELRVEKNTHRILDLFDSISHTSDLESQTSGPKAQASGLKPLTANLRPQISNLRSQTSDLKPQISRIYATFFILGWIAERLPELVREISARGHEVASHGYFHNLCARQDGIDLRNDLSDSKKLLEDITGAEVLGYRAPSFSVTNDILKVIEDIGYRYDASYNSFDKHGRYGKLNLNGSPKAGIAYRVSHSFYEIPVSNLILSRIPYTASRVPFVLPWAGGGYFRLLPLSLFKMGIQKILEKEAAFHFYFHPWEIDPDQPRVNHVSRMFRFRHYINISKTFSKLKHLISSFRHCRFQTLSQYLGMARGDGL